MRIVVWLRYTHCSYINTIMITYYIHGHGCTHNLIHGNKLHTTDPYYNYLSLVRASRLNKLDFPHRIVYATHDFTNPSPDEYQQVCDNFQFVLPIETYTPYTDLTPVERLRLHKTFDWRECPQECLFGTNNYYHNELWTPISSIISWEDWLTIPLDGGAYAADEEYTIDSTTLEILPRPSRL
jgi:hypothetical protein